MIEDYLQRIGHYASVELDEIRDPGGPGRPGRPGKEDPRLVIRRESTRIQAAIDKDEVLVILDEKGSGMNSAELAGFIGQQQQRGTKRLAIVVGGYAGIDRPLREKADLLLSLSRFTMTHELARVVLTEQIYRAFTILAGHPYHKE